MLSQEYFYTDKHSTVTFTNRLRIYRVLNVNMKMGLSIGVILMIGSSLGLLVDGTITIQALEWIVGGMAVGMSSLAIFTAKLVYDNRKMSQAYGDELKKMANDNAELLRKMMEDNSRNVQTIMSDNANKNEQVIQSTITALNNHTASIQDLRAGIVSFNNLNK